MLVPPAAALRFSWGSCPRLTGVSGFSLPGRALISLNLYLLVDKKLLFGTRGHFALKKLKEKMDEDED